MIVSVAKENTDELEELEVEGSGDVNGFVSKEAVIALELEELSPKVVEAKVVTEDSWE